MKFSVVIFISPVGDRACVLLALNYYSLFAMSNSWKMVELESFKTWKMSFKLWWEGMLVIGFSFSENRRSVCTRIPGFNGYLDP